MPQIIVTEHGSDEKRAIPCEGAELDIGRAAECAVVLASEVVSPRHATILSAGHDFFLTDLGSEQGTLLNGTPIQANERYLLRGGDVITISNYHLQFSRADALESSFNEITDSEIMEVRLLKKVLHALDKDTLPSLEVMNGSSAGTKIFLEEQDRELTIGRDPACDLAIDDYAVSRRHSRLFRQDGTIAVEDLSSKNGTYLNKKRITQEPVRDGDRIAFGTIICIYRNPREIDMAQMREDIQAEKATEFEAETMIGPAPAPPEAAEAGEAEEALEAAEEEVVEPAEEPAYPPPHGKRAWFRRLSPTEMGMLWTGLIISTVTLVLLIQLIT